MPSGYVGTQLRVPGGLRCVRSRRTGAERTGTWTTVGTMARAGWAKAIAMGATSARAGCSAARMWGRATGSGLQCRQDVGASYGFPADYDVCEATAAGERNGHVDYCRDYGPCRVGEGDCDGSDECQSGLQCRQDVGASYGFRANYDVCEATAAGERSGHVDYCRDYGPCRVGEGDCDGSDECQSGLQCRQDVGASYGFRANYDVCE